MHRFHFFGLILAFALGHATDSSGTIPGDFPTCMVTRFDPASTGQGYIFLEVTAPGTNAGYHTMILQNDGTPIWYQNRANGVYDFKVLPNGLLHYAELFHTNADCGGGDARHNILNVDASPKEIIQMGNGYLADGHDFQLLPNGHVLALGHYRSQMDLSKVIAGAYPNALVGGSVIQELDEDRNVVFQWRTWDHFSFSNYYAVPLATDPQFQSLARNPVVDAFHLNTVLLDNDGHLLVSNYPEGVQKINRQTGAVMWRLGGFGNQFTFANVSSNVALGHFAGHTVSRLANGDLLIYCNADPQATRSSTVREYQVDETNKVATLVWSYSPATNYYGRHYGSAQRLGNGNTFIGWGSGSILRGNEGQTDQQVPACTEVTSDGRVVFEMFFNDPSVASYRAYRFDWPATNALTSIREELLAGNQYVFEDTGVTLDLIVGGGGYNALSVTREPFAPVAPFFSGVSPQVLPLRVKLAETHLSSLDGVFSFDVDGFGFDDPASLQVFYRPQSGRGTFSEVSAQTYNVLTHQLQVLLTLTSTAGDLGELVFGRPDLAQVAYPPLLNEVENFRGEQPFEIIAPLLATDVVPRQVNHELPIFLSWSPKGFADSYDLEIASTSDFLSPLVNEVGLTRAFYVWSTAAIGTTYYYRVKTRNAAGASAWAHGTFETAAPLVQLTVPNGGESWQSGTRHFIQWNDTIAENVVIDLYKAGGFLKTLATNASTGAYNWLLGSELVPGSDYSVKVRSQLNEALADVSDQPFSINQVSVTVNTAPAGLDVTVDGTGYSTPATFNWSAGSLHTLAVSTPQVNGDGRRRSIFTSWSDGGSQSHSITTPATSTNYTASFSTQHLLETVIVPAGAGTISNYPAGSWQDAGQLVSLYAQTNTGYRLQFWQGVDNATSSTAQVTMNGYRRVQATFLPGDYPQLTVTNSDKAARGNLIGNIAGRTGDGTKTYYVILDSTGTNLVYASKTNTILRFGSPQGFVSATDATGFRFKDETLTNVVATAKPLGYAPDIHDVKLLPNGHALVLATEERTFDMSAIVSGGKSAAKVTGNVIQELDGDGRLVFEWHTFDHIPITDTFADLTQANFDYAHVNAVALDLTDDNLLASLRTTSEIVKINRQTGEVMWRLGGRKNQFTFVGEHAENAPYYTVGQHDIHRLPNGNLLYFDNGNISGGGVTSSDRTYSRVVEYQLNEVDKSATLIWEYRHAPDILATCTGSVKRMENGNTLIDWGCAVPTSGTIVTEVDSAGQVVFEMKHKQAGGIGSVLLGGGLTKQFWNSPDLIRSDTFHDVVSGQTYDSVEVGASMTFSSLIGSAQNEMVMRRHLDSVRSPKFSGKAPQVLMEHLTLSGLGMNSMEAILEINPPDTSRVFDTPTIRDPAQIVVYQRSVPGLGEFSALPTTYHPGTGKLRVTTTQLGEFIFAYPDVAETPSVPVILSPADQGEVNQVQPVTLVWNPQGLVRSFDVQLATDSDFGDLVLTTNGLGSGSLTLQNLLPNTQYFWRVRTVNQGGTSDWASASFLSVPPKLQLIYPAGGEVWQRFQVVTIRWMDNLSDNVALDLYKGGVSNRTFVANTASSGTYTWTVGQFTEIPPGSDYSIKIRSLNDPAVFDFSEPFSIVRPVTLTSVPSGLSITVDETNYTTPASFAWVPNSSHLVGAASPQTTGDGTSRYLFDSWSDGGGQSHSIVAPLAGATNTARFTTNYQLAVTITPPAVANVLISPPGPWYALGQRVSLMAQPDAGHLLYAWQGVDAQLGNTAQLLMDGYHAVEAKFIPTNGVPAIQTDSLTTLADGRVEFSFTAGAGLTSEATVWGTSSLNSPDWKVLAKVPLIDGRGVFVESTAPTGAARFYRVTLP